MRQTAPLAEVKDATKLNCAQFKAVSVVSVNTLHNPLIFKYNVEVQVTHLEVDAE